jgi:hypothetical protein
LKHQATPRFWQHYNLLAPDTQRKADRAYALLKRDPHHPSLHLKKVGRFWSVRVTRDFRAVAIEDGSQLAWFWIGAHDEYERLIRGR